MLFINLLKGLLLSIILSVTIITSSFACSCSEEVMSAEEAVFGILNKHFTVYEEAILGVTQVKHYTSILERLDYAIEGDTSCNGKDENGDLWVMCMGTYTDKVEVKFKDCKVTMKIESKFNSARANVLKSSCRTIKVSRQSNRPGNRNKQYKLSFSK